MKIQQLLMAVIFCITVSTSFAQSEIPKGFKKGTVTLADNTLITGYVKDNIRRNAAVVVITEADSKKKTYTGHQLVSAQLDDARFVCINGDFFQVICEGELNFLQKSSDASGSVTYNGSEAVYVTSTSGKPGDFFTYNTKSKQLSLVTKKTYDEVVEKSFAGCVAATSKAKADKNDPKNK